MAHKKRHIAILGVAAAALLVPALPASARTHVVRPGESIQTAIDAASPGDTIDVKRGTYTEYLQIVDKGRITLKGEKGAVLKPAATPGATVCTSMGELTGVCVVGSVARPSTSDRITGLRITGFEANGIFAFGTNKLRVDHTTLSSNGVYGAFSSTSTRTRFDHNLVRGNRGAAGLYIGDSPRARATVTSNKLLNNHGEGLLIRYASHGTVSRNRSEGNCVGVMVLADNPGPASRWNLSRNTVRNNNRGCLGNSEEGTLDLSGLGILLAGADHTTVSRNVIHDQRHRRRSAFYGGIVIRPGEFTKGTNPARDRVSRNVVTRNRPDINWDGKGSVSFSRNKCARSRPARVCR
jgi:nitrous oxidase accessory protein NosD